MKTCIERTGQFLVDSFVKIEQVLANRSDQHLYQIQPLTRFLVKTGVSPNRVQLN